MSDHTPLKGGPWQCEIVLLRSEGLVAFLRGAVDRTAFGVLKKFVKYVSNAQTANASTMCCVIQAAVVNHFSSHGQPSPAVKEYGVISISVSVFRLAEVSGVSIVPPLPHTCLLSLSCLCAVSCDGTKQPLPAGAGSVRRFQV